MILWFQAELEFIESNVQAGVCYKNEVVSKRTHRLVRFTGAGTFHWFTMFLEPHDLA